MDPSHHTMSLGAHTSAQVVTHAVSFSFVVGTDPPDGSGLRQSYHLIKLSDCNSEYMAEGHSFVGCSPERVEMPERGMEAALSRPISEIKAELFRALAHPARIRVLEVLSEAERSVGEMQPLVGIESSHLSQQLGVLRRAGLVTTRKEGSTVYYTIRDPALSELLAVAKRMLINSLTESTELLAGLRAAASAR